MTRGLRIAFLSGGTALAVLAGCGVAFRDFFVEEWWYYRWKHAEGDRKKEHFQALLAAGSLLPLHCLENERILYLIDVGGRGRARKGGARSFEEVRRHIRSLTGTREFAIAWMGSGIPVFPALEPGANQPRFAEATESAKEGALAFLDGEWTSEAPLEEPCFRWALLTSLTMAAAQDGGAKAICYFGSGPASSSCGRCAGHGLESLVTTIGDRFPKIPIHCFAVRPFRSSEQEEFLKGLAAATKGLYVPLRE